MVNSQMIAVEDLRRSFDHVGVRLVLRRQLAVAAII